MTAKADPKPPAGLRAVGKKFWTDVTGAFDLEPPEILLLGEACRVADTCERLAKLEDPRSVAELRLQRQLLARIIAQLDIPDSDVTAGTTIRGRAGAAKRWKNHEPYGGVA